MHNARPDDALAQLWDEVDPGHPPTPAIIATALRRRRHRRLGLIVFSFGVAAALTVGVLTVQGTSGTQLRVATEPQPAGDRPVIHPEVVRGSTDYDYAGFANIAEGVDETTVSFAGHVVGWSEGRALQDETEVRLTATLRVRVTDSFGVPDSIQDTEILVEVPRGGYVLDAQGEEFRNPGASPAYRSIDDLRKAVPEGVRVIVLGDLAPSDEELEKATPGSRILDSGTRPSASAPLVAPYPQGLVLETESGDAASGLADGDPVVWGWLRESVPASQRFRELVSQAQDGATK